MYRTSSSAAETVIVAVPLDPCVGDTGIDQAVVGESRNKSVWLHIDGCLFLPVDGFQFPFLPVGPH